MSIELRPLPLTSANFGEETRGLPRMLREAMRFALQLKAGSLTFTLADGRSFLCAGEKQGPKAEIIIKDTRFARRLMLAGDVGLGESYGDGQWDSPDITAVIALFAANVELITDFLARSPILQFFLRLRHAFNRNSKRGAKRNIAAHYDLGNDFYAHWLDPSMTYSAALFAPGDNTLEAGQLRKYRALAEAMGVKPGDHVLEIGCGWGGFAEFLAREQGAQVTALTISRAQYEYAAARIQAAGLNERVSIKFQDYRDERGTYDRIGSIEMFEAVGEHYWPDYFRVLGERLRPSGTAGLQIITIPEKFFENYRVNMDFIRRHIFPGGMLPSPERLAALAGKTGFHLSEERIFGADYAETLRQWRDAFDRNWPKLTHLGFDERFRRLWRYYLAYCEAGFDHGTIDVRQMVYVKG